MSKHTPGPWVYNIQERKIGVRDKSDTQSFGMVTAIAFIDEWDHDEFLQNGRLIAAAPDLLEALIMVRDADDDCIKDGHESIPRTARAKIDAAIAKAKGESNADG